MALPTGQPVVSIKLRMFYSRSRSAPRSMPCSTPFSIPFSMPFYAFFKIPWLKLHISDTVLSMVCA